MMAAMTVNTTAYVSFPGNGREMLEYYHSVFGGELEILTYGDQLDNGVQFPFDPPRGGLVFDQRVIHAVGMCGRNGCSTKNGGAYQYEDWKRRNQAVDAPRLNSSLSISRGVAPPRICRGVSLSSFCTHATCSGVTVAKSVPFL